MKKHLLICAAALSFLSPAPALAQEATVTGAGLDRDSAVRAAVRLAVEQVVGTFIDSRTLVEQAVVTLDEIYAKSQGFVRNIRVLEESEANGAYTVKAVVDVDTRPDAKLMSQLTMLRMLNDPRIAVVILKDDAGLANGDLPARHGMGATLRSGSDGSDYEDGSASVSTGETHDTRIESALNAGLLGLGFSHVVDAAHLLSLRDAALLRRIYDGEIGVRAPEKDQSVDYLVLGRSRIEAEKVSVPDGKGGFAVSPLTMARAALAVKIIKFDTGDLAGSFTVEGRAVENHVRRASDKAAEAAAGEAAKRIEAAFKTLGAKTVEGIEVVVSSEDYTQVEALMDELRRLPEVQNIAVREHDGKKTVLVVETSQPPHTLMRMVKAKTKLGLFVEGMSGSRVELHIA